MPRRFPRGSCSSCLVLAYYTLDRLPQKTQGRTKSTAQRLKSAVETNKRNFLCLFAFFVAIRYGLRAKPALGSSASNCGLDCNSRNIVNGYVFSFNGEPLAKAKPGADACGLPLNPDYSRRPDQIRVSPRRNCTNVITRI